MSTEEEATNPTGRSQIYKHEALVAYLTDVVGIDVDSLSPAEVIAVAFAHRNAFRKSDTYRDAVAAYEAEAAERAEAKAAERQAEKEAREAERAEKRAAKEAEKAEKAEKATKAPAKKAAAKKTPAGRRPARGKAKATSEDPFED